MTHALITALECAFFASGAFALGSIALDALAAFRFVRRYLAEHR